MEFRLATHSQTGKHMVKVWKDGLFIASIYGHDDGLRVVSKYLDGVEHEAGNPPAMVIRFTK